MSSPQDQRPRFFEEQYLGAEDLSAVLDYSRIQMARHALGAHTWGIAMGLQLRERVLPGNQVEAHILPGYAWDGFGRPIIVPAPYKIPTELFKSYVFDPAIDSGAPEGRLIEVWLRYDEVSTQNVRPGFEVCSSGDTYSRVLETFRVEVGARPNHIDRHDGITVAGNPFDAQEVIQKFEPETPAVSLFDESVPYQSLPESGAKARWLIPLGCVRWKPNPDPSQPGNFVKREQLDLLKSRTSRRYIGVVAESVQAADKVLRLRDRTKKYSDVSSNDLVWVEGDLRVEGNVRLFNHRLEFMDQNGLDNNGIPLAIRRRDQPGVSSSMQVVIGKGNQGTNTFTIGALDGPMAANPPAQFLPKLTVRDDGKVGIGTTAPTLTLDIQGDFGRDNGASTLHLWKSHIGDVGGGVLFLRSGGDIVAFDGNDRIGIGTNSPVSTLQIAGDVALQQQASGTARALPAGSTMFWNDGTWLRLNQNLDFSKPIFGVHTPGLFAPGSLNVGGAGNWGDPGAGNVWITGNVGIGTTTPNTKLHVLGNRIRLENSNKHVDIRADGSAVDLHSETNHLYIRSSGPGGNNNVIVNPYVTDGNVGIGTETPFYKLDIVGDLRVSGTARGGPWTIFSDARLKKNIEPLKNVLSRLLKLRGIRYEWQEPETMGNLMGTQLGLVAQEVEKVFPEWVSTGPDGYKELTIRGFEALTIEALRELRAEIEGLRKKLEHK